MTYGLYDTEDSVWMGNEAGPLLYEDLKIAQIAAMVVDGQLGQQMGRTRAQEWVPAEVRMRDEKPVLRDAVTTLTMLEEGLL